MDEHPITGETSTCSGSSSSKAVEASCEFDVFLSFRGPDVRKNFVSHLYDRLKSIGFRVYLDSIEMVKGEEINEDLKRAIVNSRICIPIFSKNYASSKACLLELSHMVQCERKIIPIFYDATPDDVKLKTPLYKKDLEEHRGNSKVGLIEAERWEKALLTVAKKSGYDLFNKNEAEEITSITRALIIQLMPKHQDVTDKLVEMESEVKCVKELLDLSSDGFGIVGIFGMGGMGKTTLAKVIFNQLKSSFPGCCSFLENVREILESKKLLELQRQLYKDIIDPFSADSILSYNDGIEMIAKGLENKKAFLILDDLNDAMQLANLFGHHLSFTGGSRLIITTRDRNVLDVLNHEYKNVSAYELKEMDGARALKLFSRCAFMEDSPPKEFKNLSEEVVSYTNGLPLALEVFGSLLCGNSKDAWKGILEELKKFPDWSINDKLMISYHGLKPNQQNIFLDIASYYGNLDKEYACYMWEDCGWCVEPAIKTLKDRSLIKIIKYTGSEQFWMHDVLKDLGRALIQAEADKSGKVPSRLRIEGNVETLHETEEKAHVETLCIYAPTITITRADMVGLQKLRFLELYVHEFEGDLNGLFPNLRWFCCSKHSDIKQINFNQRKLLVLELSFLHITDKLQEWNTIKGDKLKVLDLNRPVHKFPNHLQNQYIEAKEDIDWEPEKPRYMEEVFATLSNPTGRVCDPLGHVNVKRILDATNPEKLTLRFDCPITGLEEMGKFSRLWHLDLSDVKFEYFPRLPSSLLHLSLSYCEFFDGILDVSNLTKLIFLKILSPHMLSEIKGVGQLYSLEVLVLGGLHDTESMKEISTTKGCRKISSKPSKKLITFIKRNLLCKPKLQSLTKPTCPQGLNIKDVLAQGHLQNLKELDISCCVSFKELPDMSSLKSLASLRLLWCVSMTRVESFNGLESLTLLFIWKCPSLETLPDLSSLRMLQSLKLEGCDKLRCIQGIPKLQFLEIVQIDECHSLELSPPDITKLENVRSAYVSNCRKLPPIRKGPLIPPDKPFIPLRLIEPISKLGSSVEQFLSKKQESEAGVRISIS